MGRAAKLRQERREQVPDSHEPRNADPLPGTLDWRTDRAAVITTEEADARALGSAYGDLIEAVEPAPGGWFYALTDGRAIFVASNGEMRPIGAEEVA